MIYKGILFLNKLTSDDLKTYIRNVFNCLRDAGFIHRNSLHYISSMLLYKRLNDVFVETATRIELEEQSKYGWEDRDEHVFFVPKNARWSTIITTPTHKLGQKINDVFEILEEENNYLRGLFTSVDFNDKAKLPDNTILHLVQIFDELVLSNQNLESPSILGIAFTNVVQLLGSETSLFSTPDMLSNLMVRLVKPMEGMRICDPTVGMGGCLVEVAKFIEKHGGKQENTTLYGHEIDFQSWVLCKRSLLLHNIFDAVIDKRDTLRSPKLQNKTLLRYDRIVSVPPFSKMNWGREEAIGDPFDRFIWGIPSNTSSDYAFIQHIISTLNENGKASLVFPLGVLFRSGIEGEIRKSLIRDDLIEAVIALPSNLLPNTSIPICVIVINRKKFTKEKGKIVFIDGSKDFQSNRMKKELRLEDVEKILSTYESRRSITGYSRVVPLKRIQEEDYSLVPTRYIQNYDENVTEIFKSLNMDAITLEDISEEIRLFKKQDNIEEDENDQINSIFYPLVNKGEPVLMSLEKQSGDTRSNYYAEIVMDSNKANASYVCQFLNSQVGKRLRDMLHDNFSHSTISPLKIQNLKKLVIHVPKLNEQIKRLELQSKIRNTTTALHSLEQKLWVASDDLKNIKSKMDQLIRGDILDSWYENLPYPLASILLLYARNHSAEAKADHLYHFFEAFSQFIVVLLLSHFYKEQMVLEEVIKKIKGKGFQIRIKNSTFGTWVTFGMKLAKEASIDPSIQDLYDYSENNFLKMITDSSIFELLREALKLRNRWPGHGGIVNEEISRKRLVVLEDILSKLNEKIGNNFEQVTFFSPILNRYRAGEYFFLIQNIVGSNPHFKEEEVITNDAAMEEGKLYLLYQGNKQPIELVPFITICMEKKACHFYAEIVKENNKEQVRYVSYHYDKEEEKFEESPYLQSFITQYLI